MLCASRFRQLGILFIVLVYSVTACSNSEAAEAPIPSIPEEAVATDIVNLPGNGYFEAPSPPTEAAELLLTPFPPTATLLPPPTITPGVQADSQAHWLALDSNAIATEMELLKRIGTGEPNDVLWSPDGEYLAVATSRGVYLHDGESYKELRFIDMGENVVSMAFSPDSRELALGFDGTLGVWNVASGQQISAMQGGFEDTIGKIVYGTGGHIAAYGDNCRGCGDPSGQAVAVWDGRSGEQLYFRDDLFMHSDAIDISPDGDTLLYYHGGIGFLDLIDRKTVFPIEDAPFFPGLFAYELLIDPNNEHFFVSKSPWDGQPENYLVPLNGDPRIEVMPGEDCFGAKKHGVYAICQGEQSFISFSLLDGQTISKKDVGEDLKAVAIDPKGAFVAAITEGQVLIFDNSSIAVVKTFEYPTFQTVAAGTVFIDGNLEYYAATSGIDGVVSFWDLAVAELSHSIRLSNAPIRSLAFSPDQRTLATIDDESVIRLVDLENSEVSNIYDLDNLSIGPLVFSLDGLRIASVDRPSSVIFTFDLQTQELVFKGGRAYFNSYYLPDGPFFYNPEDHLMNWHWDESHILLTDLDQDGEVKFPFIVDSDYTIPESAALSSDGRYAAFGLKRSSILIGDTNSFEIIHELRGHGFRFSDGFIGAIRYMFFSPISNVLASVGYDRTTRLWNVESGIELRRLDACCYASFTADGRLLVTAGESVIEVWGVPPLP